MKALLLALMVCALLAMLHLAETADYLNLEYVKDNQIALKQYTEAQPITAAVAATGAYVLCAAISLPGITLLTLIIGAIFGTVLGTIIVSFASSIGATIAFLLSRYFFRDFIQNRFRTQLSKINDGIRDDGPSYLLTLRLIPVVPFVGVNLLMALTPVSAKVFYIFSQIGMLPATILYVNAGKQIGAIESVTGILSLPLLISLLLLATLPITVKMTLKRIKSRTAFGKYSRPKHFDYNIIVLGGGAAGLVAAATAARANAEVCLIEKQHMGGDCLHTGCVPSKTLIRIAEQFDSVTQLSDMVDAKNIECNFNRIRERISESIKNIEPKDSRERFRELGVDCIEGYASIISPWEVAVGKDILTARSIIIATGARPFVPKIPGLERLDYLTSDTIWELERLPKQLLILGGGAIGCELAQAFARLGSTVTLVEKENNILPNEDKDAAIAITKALHKESVVLHTGAKSIKFEGSGRTGILMAEKENSSKSTSFTTQFDAVLLTLGRAPNSNGFGLEELEIKKHPNDAIKVNAFLQTSIPNIYACGDVLNSARHTHVASHEAWHAAMNCLLSPLKRFRIDYNSVPACIFTEPQVSSLGLQETQLIEKNRQYDKTILSLGDLDRVVTDRSAGGFLKILTKKNKDKILGVTIVCKNAGEMISEFALAKKNNLGLNKILQTVHAYPTYSEANRHAAGIWRLERIPAFVILLLSRLNRWRRG